MRKSQHLGLSPATAENATPIQAEIILMLHKQNIRLDEVFTAAQKASAAAESAKMETFGIKEQFVQLNGKTSKTIERVASLEFKEQEAVKAEADRKIYEEGLREGKWIISKEKRLIVIAMGKFLLWLFAFIGTFLTAWPAFSAVYHFLRH